MKYFTIVIVVKNNLNGLKKTIESIINNTDDFSRHFYNILIVDGNSNDGTWEYANTLNTNSNLEILRENPTGIYPAMNFAIQNVKTEWIWFVNSSDIIAITLKQIVEIIKSISKSDKTSVISGKCGLFFNTIQEIFSTQLNYYSLSHQATIYKKELHSTLGIYDEKYITISDKLFLEKFSKSEILIVNSFFAATLVSPNNTSRNPKLYFQDYIKYYDNRLTFKILVKIFIKTIVFYIEKKIQFSLTTWFILKMKTMKNQLNDQK